MPEDDRFYSFQFFCPKDKEKEALRILKRRNDVSLWPFSLETTRTIVSSKRSEKVLEGVTLSGICFSNRLAKILDRLSQRRIAAFNDESIVQVQTCNRLLVTGIEEHGKEGEDIELRRN